MHDAVVVRELECVADLRHNRQCLACGNPFARQKLAQVHAIDEFHQKVVKGRGGRQRSVRHPAARVGFRTGYDPGTFQALTDDDAFSAGLEARLYGRQDARRYAKFVERHDAWMTQLGQSFGLAGETFRERGVVPDAGRENFQRDKAVELFLARLVNRAHAAFADQFENLQLREQRREFRDGRRIERRPFRVGHGVDRSLRQETSGTKPAQRRILQRRAALRAFVSRGHCRL